MTGTHETFTDIQNFSAFVFSGRVRLLKYILMSVFSIQGREEKREATNKSPSRLLFYFPFLVLQIWLWVKG